MEYYLTWDYTGEYLWSTTPYRNTESKVWESEYTTPDNKIPVQDGTLEFHSWEAVNVPFAQNIYKVDETQLLEIQQYATINF